MMGKKRSTGKLFYQFNLEERVPSDHLLRRVANAVDFAFVRRLTKRFYSHTGQPSVDPVVLFKMALIGYLYGITSERRLVQEIDLHLDYRWFVGYDLDEAIPDHSVLSKARKRFGPTVSQAFFTEVVRQCDRAGLIRGDKVYVDSTLVAANASLDSVSSRALVRELPAIGAHVADLRNDNPDEAAPITPATADFPPPLRRVPPPSALVPVEPVAELPDAASPSVAANAPAPIPASAPSVGVPDGQMGRETIPHPPALHVASKDDVPNDVAGGANQWAVSRTDPEAEMVSRWGVPLDLYYKVHVGVDAGQARIVTAVEATGGAVGDEFLLERIVREHSGNVQRDLAEVVADAKYGTTANYAFLEKLGVVAAIPLHATKATYRALTIDAFTDDEAKDQYRCPAGQILRRQGKSATAGAMGGIIYRARPSVCAACPLKAVCCGSAEARSVFRPDDGGVRDRAVTYLRTFQAMQSIRRRKVWVETVFGDGKERRGLRRAQFRGRDRMRMQALLTATAYNVRKLALRKRTKPVTGVGAKEGREIFGAILLRPLPRYPFQRS
jgi:transposase